MIFDTTLMENLRFGNQCAHTDDEVWALCNIVGLNPELIGQGDHQVGALGAKLSHSDCIRVSLCRALLSSANLLLLAGALDAIGSKTSMQAMAAIEIWVRHRGFPCLTKEGTSAAGKIIPEAHKKKNTAIIGTKLDTIVQLCDAVLVMGPGGDE